MTQTPLSAGEVIALVMQDVHVLAKKDKNTAQGFNFRGIDAVMNAVGPALRKHGGYIMPMVDNVTYDTAQSRNGGVLNMARVTVSYAVYGQTGDPVMGSVAAEAFDSGDKATAKAMSVAYRTFLLQLLCLPTDEPDPDTHSYELEEAVQLDWLAALDAVTSKAEARRLWTDATRSKAPKSILDAIEKKASSLD